MKKQKGLTLIEVLVAVSVFAMLGIAIYTLSSSALKGIHTYRETATIAALADKYMELARNLPYSQIGTKSGNPSGPLPDLPNALLVSYNNINYKVYYEVTNVFDTSASTSPEVDYKQVKVYIQNATTTRAVSFITYITPKGLLNQSGGAVSISVFDAVGQPVPGATLRISNTATTPAIDLTRLTDAGGHWIEVGLPTSTASYQITSSKNAYSSDQTYSISVQNPNPSKPHATVAVGQTTGISFSIDKTSTLSLSAVDQLCQAIPGVNVRLVGSKLIGTPNVVKFDSSYTTDSAGLITLTPIEWDTYTPSVTSASYMIYGSSPIQQIALLPNTTQQATLVLGPTTAQSLLIIVKDAAGNALEGATVRLQKASPAYDTSKLTAGSILYQKDWSGGSGQNNFASSSRYYLDSGSIDTTTLPLGVRLSKIAGAFQPSGWLQSSTFDTGTASSSYTTLTWNPTSQTPSTTLKFQIATNNDNATWQFLGPDGSASTYYTVPGTAIYAGHANTRYLRYKAFLTTLSTTTTPVLSNVTINYVSGCFSPGQAMFENPSAGNGYTLTISAPGFISQTITPITISGNNVMQVTLSQ